MNGFRMTHPIRMDDLGVPVFQKTSKSLYPYAPWCWCTHLRTKLGDFVGANVGKYSSTMEHMGIVIYIKIVIIFMAI